MTSTYGHPRLNWPETAKVNNSARVLAVCVNKSTITTIQTFLCISDLYNVKIICDISIFKSLYRALVLICQRAHVGMV